MNLRLLRSLVLALACAPLCLTLSAQSSSPANRIVAPVDETQLVTLSGNVHPLAQARFDHGAAPAATPTGRIMLLLGRSQAQQQGLTQYLADVQNASSPRFHKWLTPAQYGAQFGISDGDLQTVEGWLQGHGFKIEKVPQGRNILLFSGNLGQLQSAFHTSIHTLAVNGAKHFSNVSDPQIPAALAPVIAGVGPLNDFHPKPTLVRGPTGRYNTATHTIQPTLTLFSGSTPLLFVDPADAATIYDTPNTKLNANYKSGTTWDGTGVNIGIAGDSDVNTADVGNYRIAFLNQGTTSSNIPTVIVDGDDPGFNGDEVEALLDNEVAGGLAPGASLYFYTSANSDLAAGLFNAIFRALDDNRVSILNISFGGCEADQGTSGNLAILETAEQAAAQGISVTVSTGDSGSAGCDNDNTETAAQYGLAVNGLASTPYNIAVGGTDYDVLATAFSSYASDTTSGAAPYWGTATKYIPEEPWNDSTSVNTSIANNVALNDGSTLIVAGGGGSSAVYPKPAFQTSLTPNDNARDLPDVSFLAGNGLYNATWVVCGDDLADGQSTVLSSYDCVETNGSFTDQTTFIGVGGTSAAAPAFAGMLALVSQAQGGARLGQADGVLYQLAQSKYSSVFHDVTTGDNSVVCVAGSTNCESNDFLTGYNAGTEYDLASGLGSVDVKNLITNWSTVKLASTSTSLQLNSSTAAYTGTHGKAVNFNVGVDPTAATGVVGIIDTANENANGPLNNGQFSIPLTSGAGTASYNGLPGGKYTVSARYGGDAANAASTSGAISVDISPEASTTTLQVNAYDTNGNALSQSNVPFGSYVFVDATITGTAEGSATQGVATGTVTFMNGNSTLGTAAVSSGNLATWPPVVTGVAPYPAGSYSFTAAYSGDASFNASNSAAQTITIQKAPTSLFIEAVPTTLSSGSSSSVAISVNGSVTNGSYPTGTVTLTANGSTLATSNVLDGVASATVQASQLTPGINTISAVYSGDQDYATSNSTFSLTSVGGGGFSIGLEKGIGVGPSDTAIVPITLTSVRGYSGWVGFSCGVAQTVDNNVFCSASEAYVSSSGPTTGMMVVTTSGSGPGTYTATLSGEDLSTPQISATGTLTITVNASPTPSIAVLSNGNISVAPGVSSGDSSSVTIIPSGGLSGQVNLSCAVTTAISSVTSLPTCSVPSSVLLDGTNAIIAPVTVTTTATTSTGSYTATVTGASAATPAISNSSAIALTVTASPWFALTNSGPTTFVPGATTGNATTITATPLIGLTGTVELFCATYILSTVPGYPVNAPSCTVPPSISLSGTKATTFTLALSSPGNPDYPGPGIYLATVYGYDATLTQITNTTSLEVTIGTPLSGIALANGGNVTVAPGATTGNTSAITISPVGGFTGTVNLTCAVTTSLVDAVDQPSCSLPSTVTISGTTAATATLTVNTKAASSASVVTPLTKFFLGSGTALAMILFFGIPARRRAWRTLFGFAVFCCVAGAIGCGGSGGGGGGGGGGGQSTPGTTPGTYTVTVTGTDAATGKLTSNTTVTVTVN
jgi:hypothetical protein